MYLKLLTTCWYVRCCFKYKVVESCHYFLGNFMFMRIWEVVVNEITTVEMVEFGWELVLWFENEITWFWSLETPLFGKFNLKFWGRNSLRGEGCSDPNFSTSLSMSGIELPNQLVGVQGASPRNKNAKCIRNCLSAWAAIYALERRMFGSRSLTCLQKCWESVFDAWAGLYTLERTMLY